MPVLDLLEVNAFSDEVGELIDDINYRIRIINDYHRDAEVEGLDVYMGPNGLSTAVRSSTLTASAILDSTDKFVHVDATSGAITITLPPVATSSGIEYYIKKTDSSGNAVTVDGNASETIDGATTQALSSQYDSIFVYCNGTVWWKH